MGQRLGPKIVVGTLALTAVLVFAAAPSGSASTTGAAPNSEFCKAYRHSLGANSSSAARAAKAESAMKSGNWTVAQRTYLSAFADQAKEDQILTSVLGGAPSDVKTATAELVAYVKSFRTIVRESDSIAAFTKAATALQAHSKVVAAETTLAQYTLAQCGVTTG